MEEKKYDKKTNGTKTKRNGGEIEGAARKDR